MSTVNAGTPSRILSTSLHHLDIDQGTCVATEIPVGASDLENYLGELLTEIQARPQKREYRLSDPRTQFGTSLAAFLSQGDLTRSPEAEAMAQRLLRIELATEDKYGHLKTTGTSHIKKGSFLQFKYREHGDIHYLGVKVEHQSILDEVDFRRKIGLGESQKIYKACKVRFDSTGAIGNPLVFDTNAKPSRYWWHEFWELAELRTDAHNTEHAIAEVCRVLAPLKRTSPADHTLLRNAAIAAFKQSGRMNFDQFITDTFANYQPVEAGASQELSQMVLKMRQLPEQKKFDSQFDLVPSAVPYRRVNLPLTREITLSFDEGMSNLEDKIWASRTRDGKDVVVVEAPEEATRRFTFKALD